MAGTRETDTGRSTKHDPPPTPSAQGWRRWRRGVLLAGILLALVVAGAVGRDAYYLYGDVRRAETELQHAASLANRASTDDVSSIEARALLASAGASLTAADSAIDSARRRTNRLHPILTGAGYLPGWVGGLPEIDGLLAVARHVVDAGLSLHGAATAIVEQVDQPRTVTDAPLAARLATSLTEARPQFNRAAASLDRAAAARAEVRSGRLHGPLEPAGEAVATFDRRMTSLQSHVTLLQRLPDAVQSLFGMDGARSYAILGQNSAELRPTGGFIGSLGLITIERGAITREEYRGSYTIDNPSRGYEPMPAPMAAHLGFTGWAARDANWSPDFPSSARKFEQLLFDHQDLRVDGVIGFTTFAVAMLLETLGPLPVDGFAEPVTPATWYNLAERMIYFGAADPKPGEVDQRKGEVLEPLLQAVLARLQQTSSDELPALLRTFRRMAAERQVLVYLHDAVPARLAGQYGVDGRFTPPAEGDVIGVVDANLSYSKVSLYVRQRLRYDVWLSERGLARRSSLTVEYHNTMTAEAARDPRNRVQGGEWDASRQTVVPKPGIFGTYARVYVPRNSRLMLSDSSTALPALGRDLGFATFEAYYSIPASERRGFTYTYQIPIDAGRPDRYRLRLIKQPGTAGHEVEVFMHVPEGSAPISNVPTVREDDALVYRGRLTQNLDLYLTFPAGTRAPN